MGISRVQSDIANISISEPTYLPHIINLNSNYASNSMATEIKTNSLDSHIITVLSPCRDSLSLVIAATLAKLMSSIHYKTDKNI